MATGAAIAGAVVTVGGFALNAYSTYQDHKQREEQEELNKINNRLIYNQSMSDIDNAEDDLTRNYNNTLDSMALDRDQTLDTADREFDDAVAKEGTALRKAGQELTDFRVDNDKKEGASNASAGNSGVKKTGTVAQNLDLEEQENEELEGRAEQNIEDEVGNFDRATESHWAQVDDYQERYDQQLTQLEAEHDAKLAQLSESRDYLTARYKSGVNMANSQSAYYNSMDWLNYANGAMGAINTGLSTYSALSNIFSS